ncbi:AcaB family transcriptional regulator [Vibrio agarivorans]|uniref:AcaB family transcriptional regulator n=1 Tax=Vibrio agarivorans TaxID=153622 RepID=A0ABT7Y748_9VIBR|nr:AcaB family transcriptional regulator [Vibrio agarivorans]MDN2483827.1 AcaB family transcriptional regulator [Vibrio agarivorans]
MTELLNIVQQGDQETAPEVAKSELPKAAPTTPPKADEAPSSQANETASQEGGKTGVSNVNMDHYGLDEIRQLKPRPSPKRSALKIGFYTVDAAKLLIDQRRENKRLNKVNYQKGLEGFDRNLTKLLNPIRDDNPFADSVLLDLEDRLETITEEVATQSSNVEQQIEATFKAHNASVQYKKNDYITELEPKFNHAITMRLVWLVKEIDQFWHLLELAQSNAILTARSVQAYKHQTSKNFRSILHLPDRFHFKVVTRNDIAHKTKTGIKALEDLLNPRNSNSLRPEVLLMTRRSAFAPPVTARRNGNIDDIKDKLSEIAEMLDNTVLPGAKEAATV